MNSKCPFCGIKFYENYPDWMNAFTEAGGNTQIDGSEAIIKCIECEREFHATLNISVELKFNILKKDRSCDNCYFDGRPRIDNFCKNCKRYGFGGDRDLWMQKEAP